MATLILKVERPAYGGFFIGRHEGKVVMIKGAVLPGETVAAVIENEKKDYLTVRVKKIIGPSEYRIKPACKYFGNCGGCHLQHAPYARQIELKQEVLRDCLKRLAKIEKELSAPIIDDAPWNYRLRGQFKVSRGDIGFYRENTRDVVDIDSCPLMDEKINGLLKKIRPVLKDLDIKEIHITVNDFAVALIKLPAQIKSQQDINKLAGLFLSMGFPGLLIETGDNKVSRSGKTFITLDLEGLKYTISPEAFFQSHWGLNLKVVKFIKDTLQPLKGKSILDLYAGAGNFSMPLAGDAGVIAVEGNPHAIEDGRRNQEINNIKNYRFVNSTAEDFYAEGHFDIVVLDPPRTGITNIVAEKILSLMPDRIVYISCNPATFARDLKKLQNKYDIELIRMIDFFPQTFHIESISFLRLR